MKRLLVTGLGFHAEKVLQPAQACQADGLLMVFGDHERSREVERQVRDANRGAWTKSVEVPDWDLPAMARALVLETRAAVNLLGGPARCRPIVNLTAGHGFLHAGLTRLAWQQGCQMVCCRDDGTAVFSSPYEMGGKALPPAPLKALKALASMAEGATVRRLGEAARLASSSAYHAVAALQRGGLAEPDGRGGYRLSAGGRALSHVL